MNEGEAHGFGMFLMHQPIGSHRIGFGLREIGDSVVEYDEFASSSEVYSTLRGLDRAFTNWITRRHYVCT
jgi:hypothetical protein